MQRECHFIKKGCFYERNSQYLWAIWYSQHICTPTVVRKFWQPIKESVPLLLFLVEMNLSVAFTFFHELGCTIDTSIRASPWRWSENTHYICEKIIVVSSQAYDLGHDRAYNLGYEQVYDLILTCTSVVVLSCNIKRCRFNSFLPRYMAKYFQACQRTGHLVRYYVAEYMRKEQGPFDFAS